MLSVEEVRKQIREPRKRRAIQRAILHQNRLRFHVQTTLTADLSQPVNDFFAFVKNLLPHDKFKMFKALFRYPVKSNEVTAICFDKLSRIFDGKNPAFAYQFMTTEQRDDWEWYRQEKLKEPEIWSTKGWEFFKTEINSILIVDLPREQRSESPEPYFYWLPIGSVITFECNRTDGVMDFIIYRENDNVVVIDDASYRVFEYKNNDLGALISDNPHDLGYCPARFFWNEPISLKEPDVKASPLTKELESLDWFLFYAISKRHLDLYGSYPIYSGYEQACDFRNDESGDYCDGGFLKDRQGHYMFDSAGLLMRCPKCGDKRIIGAGSFVEVPVPNSEQPDLRNPVQMLSVDRSSLDYNVQECERLKNEIITSVVGTNEEITTRDALNEQQIKANFESQSTILNRVKKGFEQAQQFVDETCCRLRYGKLFISAKINYGTDFYIYDVADLRRQYKSAKDNGASESELDALHDKIIEAEYRNNPTQLQRMIILSEIEPYRHLTRDEVIELYGKGIVSERDMRVKLNFSSYVRRFERENTNILEFGTQVPFVKKIENINNRLTEYAGEKN